MRPTFLVGVPRIWETFYNGAMRNVEHLGRIRKGVIQGALEGSRVRTEAVRLAEGLRVDPEGRIRRRGPLGRLGAWLLAIVLTPPHLVADLLVYRRLRNAVGGRLRCAISGGGPLPAHVDEFLTRAGLPLRNGYGLTESSPVISVRRHRPNRLGTIGPPIPETEVRVVGESGEDLGTGARGVIHARGPQIMRGYFRNEEATRQALPGDGWLNTGDVGMLSDAGDLIITGRAKDTIVLSGGENVEPEPLETVLTASPLIEQAVLVGHGRKTLGALIVPDFAVLLSSIGRPATTPPEDLVGDPAVQALLRAEVGRCLGTSRGYRHFEQVGRIHILDRAFSVEEQTLTATLKIRRAEVERLHEQAIAAMFGSA